VGYRFAIGVTEVTVAQFKHFDPKYTYDNQELHTDGNPACPAAHLNWKDAARYCDWLSKEEGLEPFYKLGAGEQWQLGVPADGRGRPGYRLATVEEWQHACLAGAENPYFGASTEILGEVAWYLPNAQSKLHPAGLRKPNSFGLFDMLGNVREWCHDGG